MGQSIVWKCDASECVAKQEKTAWEPDDRPPGWIEITIDAGVKSRVDKREQLFACCEPCALEICRRYLIAPQYGRFVIERI